MMATALEEITNNNDDDDDGSSNHAPEEEEINHKKKEQEEDALGPKSEAMKGEETEKTTSMLDITGDHQQEASEKNDSFWARRSKAIARHPWYYLIISLVIASIFSVIGMVMGNFRVEVNNTGWTSRGTFISDRASQVFLLQLHLQDLAAGDEELWQDLTTKVQPGWESDEGGGRMDQRRRRQLSEGKVGKRKLLTPASTFKNEKSMKNHRQVQQVSSLEGCDLSYYYSGRVLGRGKLWPIWRITKPDVASALDPQAIHDICVAEHNTQSALEQEGLCVECDTGRCYPPFSLVFYARIQVGDINFSLSCDELADTWSAVASNETALLQDCVEAIKASFDVDDSTLPYPCPAHFSPTMVDADFGAGKSMVEYTSSVFATLYYPEELYEHEAKYDRGRDSDILKAAYDNEREDFNNYFATDAVGGDMLLAVGSALITGFAMLLHTRSPWITVVGLVQIIFSFPLAFFVYTFITRLEFFPFLNFIGVFVVFALGADDVFVAIDKWKNARIDKQDATVEEIAAIALPDAAGAMGLTTLTTAVAFFATAICPVAPLKCFAVFCGLLVVFDYFMCVLLIFPALCIYDDWLEKDDKKHFCCSFQARKRRDLDDAEEKESLIRRILVGFYTGFHKVRWILFVACIAATIVSIIFATKLELPQSSIVRLLRDSYEYEQAYDWRQEILLKSLQREVGAPGAVVWGVKAADTGDHNDPKTFTQLVLDDAFDPSTAENQEYLLNFCDSFFQQEFAEVLWDRNCSMNLLDSWLESESNSTAPTDEYTEYCGNATGLPMDSTNFHSCASAWAVLTGDDSILDRNGTVEIIHVFFQQRVQFETPYSDLHKEWHLIEDWMKDARRSAPAGVNAMFHSSGDFWWYDTNGQMLQTAFAAAAIALGFSGVVVLFSSRSVVLTCFSIFTIGYVLAATTATLVASGWTLGFLESINFAILIGISCDFVIHFGYAYSTAGKSVSRHDRTLYALIRMGPSILAAAVTTIGAAVIMLFTTITFFGQFAQILLYTILHATIGSFVVYLTLTDCIGPSEPTYLMDKLWDMVRQRCANTSCCRKQGDTL